MPIPEPIIETLGGQAYVLCSPCGWDVGVAPCFENGKLESGFHEEGISGVGESVGATSSPSDPQAEPASPH